MVMHLMRQFGAPAWIVEAREFPHFLEMAYKSHFGEIWLYDNDLQVVGATVGDTFRSLYLALICGTLSDNIDAVKIMVRKDCENQVFLADGPRFKPPADSPVMNNLRHVLEVGGKERLETFYFVSVAERFEGGFCGNKN